MATPSPASANLHFPDDRVGLTTGAPEKGGEAGVVLWRDFRRRFDIISNPKSHTPNLKQIQNYKAQISNTNNLSLAWDFVFGNWCLFVFWCL